MIDNKYFFGLQLREGLLKYSVVSSWGRPLGQWLNW